LATLVTGPQLTRIIRGITANVKADSVKCPPQGKAKKMKGRSYRAQLPLWQRFWGDCLQQVMNKSGIDDNTVVIRNRKFFWGTIMARRLVTIVILVVLSLSLTLTGGCANNAQTGAAYGGAGGAIIGAVTGGAGGAVVGGCLGAAGGYVIGNEQDK